MTTSDELERLARARVLGLSVTIRDKAGGLRSEHRGTFGETRMSNADIARGYLRRGWCPIPVQFKSKKPNTPDWRHMRLREDDLEGAFSGKISIGVVLGPPSNGLADVDLDCREAIAIAPFMLPRTGAIFGRHSALASHWLYYSSLASRAARATIPFKDPMKPTDDAMLLEARVGDARPIRYGLTGLADARSAADANTISNHL